MNKELEAVLNDAIDAYNEEVMEAEYIWWWDVINNIKDLTDDDEVIRIIIAIERMTEKLQGRRAAGL